MIDVSNVEDIGNGQLRCRVVLEADQVVQGQLIPAGVYDPYIVVPGDRFGLAPAVRQIIRVQALERRMLSELNA